MDLYHRITDPDSAEVRRFIVAANLADQVNFRNVFYESHAKALEAATGSSAVPCLILHGGRMLRGKAEILAWLKAQPSKS